jgi:hypothetical protein
MITAEATANAIRRHSVDVWNDTSVCPGHIEVKLHVTTIQIECSFRGCSTVSLDAPTAILELHAVAIRHDEVASIWAIDVCRHGGSKDVGQQKGLHDEPEK